MVCERRHLLLRKPSCSASALADVCLSPSCKAQFMRALLCFRYVSYGTCTLLIICDMISSAVMLMASAS